MNNNNIIDLFDVILKMNINYNINLFDIIIKKWILIIILTNFINIKK